MHPNLSTNAVGLNRNALRGARDPVRHATHRHGSAASGLCVFKQLLAQPAALCPGSELPRRVLDTQASTPVPSTRPGPLVPCTRDHAQGSKSFESQAACRISRGRDCFKLAMPPGQPGPTNQDQGPGERTVVGTPGWLPRAIGLRPLASPSPASVPPVTPPEPRSPAGSGPPSPTRPVGLRMSSRPGPWRRATRRCGVRSPQGRCGAQAEARRTRG